MLTEDDIRKAANELLGIEGENWQMVFREEDGRLFVVFDHYIPVRKRIDFDLRETKCNPRKRIQRGLDQNLILGSQVHTP